ncbi:MULTISPECIES: chromophore lyase CpcT/CpeT [unclassified Nostoc]|uniref:chromophore lyase CpcT/CpeT n=1 Tax=unclassified Nostoc TaxID=2593658 RepID=UPI00263247AF|nr:chromophore lyase CpcT/CpeT [Nostoc sp. S13]MDF5737416.1 chromophore lyase CpcT/CpeT [Nostoc sp. S13]
MHLLKVSILTVLVTTFSFVQQSRADTIAPPIKTQVKEVAQWFTGFFDNAQQIANSPSVPLITISNCSVQLDDSNPLADTQNVYLEQESPGFERLRLYSFSEENSVVNLSINSFLNENTVRGLCNHSQSTRTISINNVEHNTCNLQLFWEQNSYIGNNAPNGCITSDGFKVVSDVTIEQSSIDSLDKIFDAKGNLLVATPIEFRRVEPVPEPSVIFGLLALGIWSTKNAISDNLKDKFQKNKTSVSS